MRRSTAWLVACFVVGASIAGAAKPPKVRERDVAKRRGAEAGQDESMRILTRSSAPGLAFQFMPCLNEEQRRDITAGLSAKLKDPETGAAPSVGTRCVGQTNPLDGIETIGIWLRQQSQSNLYGSRAGAALAEGAQDRGLAEVALLEGDDMFAWSVADWFLERVRARTWEVQPRRLARNGTPSPRGSIHLQGLSFRLDAPDRVRTEVRGFIDAGPNIDFTASVRDTITLERGKLRLSQTSDLDADTGWLKAGLIFFSILLPPVGMPLYDELAAAEDRDAPGDLTSKSLGTLITLAAPDVILLEGSVPSRRNPQTLTAQKADFTHTRFAVSSSGVTGGGTYRQVQRSPRVGIVGPRDPVSLDDRSPTLRYAIATTDMRATTGVPLRVEWSVDDGQVANAAAQSAGITFNIPNNVAPGQTVTRRVSVEVTDADGLVARGSADVRISYQREARPPICTQKPWLPQCSNEARRRH